jgi:hypothetical protein
MAELREPTRPRTRTRGVVLLLFALVALLVTASAADARLITGTAKADTLRGTAKADMIYGKARADRLFGGRGADRLVGGKGRDRVSCGAGRDVVIADRSDRVARNCERVIRLGHQHGELTGHLTGTGAAGDIQFVGRADVTDTPDLVADVTVSPDGNWAFLAHWGEPDCAANSEAGGINSPDAGAWVIDIRNPSSPDVVNFIPHSQDSRPGEGMHVINLTTKWFSGNVLAMNNEQCGFQGKGGVSLWDVTNPLKPMKLSEHFGDRGFADFNEIHSVFVWDAGDRAFAVTTDNIESSLTDVDILEITNPHRPRLIAELQPNLEGVFQPELGLQDSNLHDMVVQFIDGHWILLLSYWDGGYVQYNVDDPANPVFIGDTDYPAVDPELLASTGTSLPPEGNGHQAEFTANSEMFIATDEDFAPYRPLFTALYGPGAADDKTYFAGEFGWTVPIVNLSDGKINGPTIYGGYGCPAGPPVPPASALDSVTAAGEDQVLVLQRGPVGDPAANFEACFFSEKVEVAQNAGYDAVVIANHHVGSGAGALPDAHLCGSQGHVFTPTIPGVCVGHRALHELFGDSPSYEVPYAGSEPAVGTIGSDVDIPATFDGWGYVWLYDRQTRVAYDTYAIDEAHDPDFAQGFGDLSVHEVATHKTDSSQAYLSYYAGGLRSLEIQCSGGESTCELVETGRYLDPMGNDFWGVETFVKNGTTYVLGSDRDDGLWIFRDTN